MPNSSRKLLRSASELVTMQIGNRPASGSSRRMSIPSRFGKCASIKITLGVGASIYSPRFRRKSSFQVVAQPDSLRGIRNQRYVHAVAVIETHRAMNCGFAVGAYGQLFMKLLLECVLYAVKIGGSESAAAFKFLHHRSSGPSHLSRSC